MSSRFGNTIVVSTFGTSHGSGIGAVVDGLPCGEVIDLNRLSSFMKRRAPGHHHLQTPRKEADVPEFLSGIESLGGDMMHKSILTGSPLSFVIRNTSQHSGDYDALKDIPRPSHADYTARMRYGKSVDMRGGGHFSARLTAPLCVAGGIALQLLEAHDIRIAAHLARIGPVSDGAIDLANPDMHALIDAGRHLVAMISPDARANAAEAIAACKEHGDSVGGIVEVVATGLPAGLGHPNFDGIENRLAVAAFGIPAVKGVSFGSGFDGCTGNGSTQNDPFVIKNGLVRTATNNSGGIQGGITNGMPLVMQVAVKPTASIYTEQQSISLSAGTPARLKVEGRHDPCVALRAVPVVEAVTALVLLDFITERDGLRPVRHTGGHHD